MGKLEYRLSESPLHYPNIMEPFGRINVSSIGTNKRYFPYNYFTNFAYKGFFTVISGSYEQLSKSKWVKIS